MPTGQIVGVLPPVLGQYDPTGQLMHTDWRPISDEYVPVGHGTGADNPVVLQYVPTGHGVGIEVLELAQYVPSGHGVHWLEPVFAEYVPGLHPTQVEELVAAVAEEYVPAAHSV